MALPRTIHRNGVCYRYAASPSSLQQTTVTFRFPTAAAAEEFWPQLQALPGESRAVTHGAVATVVCTRELVAQVTQLAQQRGGVPADLNTGRTT